MSNGRRVSPFFSGTCGIAFSLLGYAAHSEIAMATAPGASRGLLKNLSLFAGAALAATAVAFSRRMIEAARQRWQAARFLRRAKRMAHRDRAVAVIWIPDLARLPARKGKRAMASLRLYLEGFLREGELMGRLERFAYALCLAAGDGAAFSQRLELLRQDAGFLYMAAYPGMRITARVAACRDRGQGLEDALRCARADIAQD